MFAPLKQKEKTGQSGFTLLLAALISAIVLSLGSSIFTIARKQVILSSIGRDSQFAFYAADTAAECALYYDIRLASHTGFVGFATSSASPTMNPITCDGVTVTPTASFPDINTGVSSFRISSASPLKDGLFTLDEAGNPQQGNCAEVTVTKNLTLPSGNTIIHADGYSTPCSSLTDNLRTLQRSIEIQY